MLYVSGLDREAADRHFRWRPAAAPGDLASRPGADDPAPLLAAHRAGDITIETDDADRRVTVMWNDPGFGDPVLGAAIARPGYGGILLGEHPRRFRSAADRAAVAGCRAPVASGRGGRNTDAGALCAGRCPGPFLRQLCRCLWHPDRDAGSGLVRALQRLWHARSRDAELVHDKGNHLHSDRPLDPQGLVRLGL